MLALGTLQSLLSVLAYASARTLLAVPSVNVVTADATHMHSVGLAILAEATYSFMWASAKGPSAFIASKQVVLALPCATAV